MMIDVNKENFEAEVTQHTGKIFAFFGGPGWAPCEAIKPFVTGCGEKYGDKIKFVKIDTGSNKRLAMSQKVMSIPAVLIYGNGEKIETLLKDDVTESNIEALIAKYI